MFNYQNSKINMSSLKIVLCIALSLISWSGFYAQDLAGIWANVEMYQIKNQELTVPLDGEHRVVFMGNSITEGWSHRHPEFFKGKPYVNRGIGGQTTPQMLLRFRKDVINLEPSVVVILAGINDIARNTGPISIEGIAENIFSMTDIARANNIEVILCSVLPAFDFPWRPGIEPAEKVVKLNALIKSYAQRNNIIYVDYFSEMVNDKNGLKKELGDDGIHPNLKGYLVMEPMVEKEINKVLD